MVSNGYFPQLALPSTLWEKERGFPVGLQPPKRGSLDKLICPWPDKILTSGRTDRQTVHPEFKQTNTKLPPANGYLSKLSNSRAYPKLLQILATRLTA
jgi:hypothetical protein